MVKREPPEFVSYIHDRLTGLGDIECSRYFGGWGFRTEGELFAIIMGQMLYFRVNDQLREELAAIGSKPFSYKKGEQRIIVERFYTAPERCIHDVNHLKHWAEKAKRQVLSNF